MKVLPTSVRAYKRTPEFTEATIPEGLLRNHTTREGSWATIVVLEGELVYRILQPELAEWILSPNVIGIVEPQVPHEVARRGPVRFYVEFYR